MPKQQLAINRFEGGLVTDPNDRDLGENQFSILKGFSVDSLGGIKMMGGFATHAIINASEDTTMTFNYGLGLFAFSSDKDPGGAETATNYLASTNGDYIHIYDDTDDSWNFEDEGDGKSYSMNFKIENLKILEGNYAVSVSSKGISHFKNKDIELEYFIALEPDSKFDA